MNLVKPGSNQSFCPQVILLQLLSPLFSSNLACFLHDIPCSISHKAKQAHFKCNIPHSLSRKQKHACFKYNIPRSRIGG